MENAADALKMVAAVLVFVMALSITINSFTETRIAATTILNNKDKEYDYTYVEDALSFLNSYLNIDLDFDIRRDLDDIINYL